MNAMNENMERKHKRLEGEKAIKLPPYAPILEGLRSITIDSPAMKKTKQQGKCFRTLDRWEREGSIHYPPLLRSDVQDFLDKSGRTAGDIARSMGINPVTVRNILKRKLPNDDCVPITYGDLKKIDPVIAKAIIDRYM